MPSPSTAFSSWQESQPHRSLTGIMGFLAVGLAMASLLGWITDTVWLQTFGSGEVTMKVNTILMLLLTGLELLRLGTGRQRPAYPGYLLPGLVLTLALLTIAEYAFSLNLGIDEFLFIDSEANPLVSPPGRPALLSCIGFSCLSTALLFYRRAALLVAGQMLALFVVLLSFGVLLGHALGIYALYSFGTLSAVALHTALGFLAAGIGVLGLYPQRGFVQTAISPYLGGIITRYMWLYVLIVPPLLTIVYQTSVARQFIVPQSGLTALLFLVMFGTLLLFYRVAVQLNALDAQNRLQIDQLLKSQEAQKEQFDLLTSIQNASQTGITALKAVRDAAGAIVDFEFVFRNEGISKLTGKLMQETIGQRLLTVYSSFRQIGLFDRYVAVVENGQPQSFEQFYDTDGVEGWFDVHVCPWNDGIVVDLNSTTQLRLAEREKLQQAELLERVMNTTPTAIVVHKSIRNEAGEIVDFRMTQLNQKAVDLAGNPAENVLHRRISQYFPGVLDTPLFEQYRQVVDTGEPIRTEVMMENRWYDFSVARFGDGIIVAAQDVTPMRQARHQLEVANYELKRSNDSLQSFAYIASHDLQEPLRKITSFSDVLHTQYAGQFDAGATDIIQRINGSAERMRLLIHDLLNYARVDTQQEPLKPVKLSLLIRGLQEEELWATMNNSKVKIELGDLPTLKADPMQMHQLFQNLLSNAIKFCSKDKLPVVTISSQVVHQSTLPAGMLSPALAGDSIPADQTYYEISVADNGIGFDEKYKDRIFQIFQRLHGKSHYAGSGIGLAICYKIVERHKGCITAESNLGEGSTFRVYLPVQA